MFQHLKLLSRHTVRSTRICLNQIDRHPTRVHRRVQLIEICAQWVGLLRDQQRSIWTQAGRKTCERSTCRAPRPTRLLSMCNYTWLMAPQMETHHFHPHCGRLWNKIRGQTTRRPPLTSAPTKLQSHHGLDGFKICWYRHYMGLHQTHVPAHHERLHQQSPHQI